MDAILENVMLETEGDKLIPDYFDTTKTENGQSHTNLSHSQLHKLSKLLDGWMCNKTNLTNLAVPSSIIFSAAQAASHGPSQ